MNRTEKKAKKILLNGKFPLRSEHTLSSFFNESWMGIGEEEKLRTPPAAAAVNNNNLYLNMCECVVVVWRLYSVKSTCFAFIALVGYDQMNKCPSVCPSISLAIHPSCFVVFFFFHCPCMICDPLSTFSGVFLYFCKIIFKWYLMLLTASFDFVYDLFFFYFFKTNFKIIEKTWSSSAKKKINKI